MTVIKFFMDFSALMEPKCPITIITTLSHLNPSVTISWPKQKMCLRYWTGLPTILDFWMEPQFHKVQNYGSIKLEQ